MSDWWPTPAKPRPVEGGMRARSRRGAIAQTWWSERFITVLESLGVGGRLQRGRTYARKGQVMDLSLDAGAVTARVQGSRARPYKVRIGLTAFDKQQWAAVCQALADDAWYAARLLAGEMPPDIEEVFAGVGLSLFPTHARDLSMDCSCPDWSVPCKHLAAVFYLLAESFDDDPFAVMAWRGREREDLLAAVSALRGGGGRVAADEVEDAAVPLSECLDAFWVMPTGIPRRAAADAPPDALLDQLPELDLTVRRRPLPDLLRPAYLRIDPPE
ncbi:MAG: SWIM zinc finger family protein [Ornithinimicrobium sp.]